MGLSTQSQVALQHLGSGVAAELANACFAVDSSGVYTVNPGRAAGNYQISSLTTAANLFINGSNGRVGIGTTSPATTLDVVGTLATSGAATFGAITTVSAGGLVVTADGLTVTAGGATITAGNVVVTAGTFTTTVGAATIGGLLTASAGVTVTGAKTTCALGTTGYASLNIPAGGAAPTTPVNGDIWQESNTIKVRLNGATVTLVTV